MSYCKPVHTVNAFLPSYRLRPQRSGADHAVDAQDCGGDAASPVGAAVPAAVSRAPGHLWRQVPRRDGSSRTVPRTRAQDARGPHAARVRRGERRTVRRHVARYDGLKFRRALRFLWGQVA